MIDIRAAASVAPSGACPSRENHESRIARPEESSAADGAMPARSRFPRPTPPGSSSASPRAARPYQRVGKVEITLHPQAAQQTTSLHHGDNLWQIRRPRSLREAILIAIERPELLWT